jgi:hypothetical protein
MRSLLRLSLVLVIAGLALGVLNLYIDGRIGAGPLLCSVAAVVAFVAITVGAITRDK